MPWKITAELIAISPFVALFIAAFTVETRRAVATARSLRRGRK